MTLAILSLALAFCFTGGLLAILARIVAATLIMAYALTGFAVLHTLTMALKQSRALAGMHLRRRGDLQLARSRHGGSRSRRRGFRPSPALPAGKTAAPPRILKLTVQL